MKMVKIKLATIKRQLQEKMHYPLEHMHVDDGYLTLDEAFDILLYGFGKWLVLTGRGSKDLVYQCQERGWITEKYADLFTDYCLKGWRVI